jgi:hypothetical protein
MESDRMNVLHMLAKQDHRNPAWQDVPPPPTHPHIPPHTAHATNSVATRNVRRREEKRARTARLRIRPSSRCWSRPASIPMQPTPWARCAALCHSSSAGERLDLTLSALCCVCRAWYVCRVVCECGPQGVLHLLCLRGHTEAVRWLLSRKLVTDINATNAHGDTALHYGTHTHTPFSPPPPV